MIKVAVFGIVASLIAMKIKTIRPEIAVVIAVISSILLAMYGLCLLYTSPSPRDA